MQAESAQFKKNVIKNVSYNAIGQVVAFLFQSMANIVLCRELVSEDYGVAGFALICVNFLKSFSGLGINSAAVHADEFDEKGMATAFTLRQILGLVSFVLAIALSGFAQHFIDHKAIPAVMKVFAFSILIDNFSMVSVVLLARKLKYSVISLAETGLSVASSLTAVVLAVNGFKYWSIVYAFLASNLVFTLITYCYMPYRMTFGIDVKLAKQYLRFGIPIFATGLLSFCIFNLDNFIIGSVGGAAKLGYYSIAFSWGSMMCSILSSVVLRMMFPTFSRMRGDSEEMKKLYLNIIQITALFSVLFNLGLFCVADNLLVSVLGKGTDKWLPSLDVLRILCFYGIVRSLIEPASSLLMANGKVAIPFRANLLVAVAELALVYPAIKYGSIEIVGLVVLLSYAGQSLVYLPALKQVCDISLREIVGKIWPALPAGIVMCIVYFYARRYFSLNLISLVVSAATMTMLYAIVYGLLTDFKIFKQVNALLVRK